MKTINFDEEYDADERKQRKLSKENTQCLNLYWEYLNGLSLKVKCKHYQNIECFLNIYLLDYELLSVRQGTKKLDYYLGNYFIRKFLWSTPNTIKASAVSIKKFYECMLAHGKIKEKEYNFLCETIKNNLTKWQDTCARYNDPSVEQPWENSEVCAKLQKFSEQLAGNVDEKKRLEELEANANVCKYCRDLILLLVDILGQKMSESGDGTITDVVITDGFIEDKFCSMCRRKTPSLIPTNPAQ